MSQEKVYLRVAGIKQNVTISQSWRMRDEEEDMWSHHNHIDWHNTHKQKITPSLYLGINNLVREEFLYLKSSVPKQLTEYIIDLFFKSKSVLDHNTTLTSKSVSYFIDDQFLLLY